VDDFSFGVRSAPLTSPALLSPGERRENSKDREDHPMRTSWESPKDALTRARRLRKESTPAERALWKALSDRRFLGLKFRRQVPIGPYVADFYCHALKLVLELDGDIHEAPHQITHDENRDANLSARGYIILRLTNQSILETPEIVLEEITRLAKSLDSKRLSPSSPQGRGGPGR
jgi:very-short-patch-repair endonuclease